MTRGGRLLVALVAAAMLPGCSGAPAATAVAPEPPAATLERPARAAWGDTVAARVGALAGHVHDQLHERYGASREMPYVGHDAAAVAALDNWYAARLSGWSRKPLSLPPEEHGFAFTAGDRAFVVAWLDPLPDGRVPVLTMRYGQPDRAAGS